MSEIKVGMRLESVLDITNPSFTPITVTEITQNGFKYDIDQDVCIHPRLGMTVKKHGHEHFGVNGYSLYKLIGL